MLSFVQIRSKSDIYFKEFYDLYQYSFRPAERRKVESLELIMKVKTNFFAFAVLSDGAFVGFVNYWDFEKFIFIEHFAVSPGLRGHHLGSDIIKVLLLQIQKLAVLEVETPQSKLAVKRIHFWERLGFYVLSNYYMQPPYDDAQFLIPMLIMSSDYHYVNRHFLQIKSLIYKDVYNYVSDKTENY